MNPTHTVEVIRKRRDFLACAASGRKFVRPTLVMQARRRSGEDAAYVAKDLVRVGFTCTKTLGNAVTRNRIKRRLRAAAFALLPQRGTPGQDYVLIGRGAALRCPFETILSDMTTAITRLNKHENRTPSAA